MDCDTKDREIEKLKQIMYYHPIKPISQDKENSIKLMEMSKQKIETKFKKDIDNINLMHTQELYILKKKDSTKK